MTGNSTPVRRLFDRISNSLRRHSRSCPPGRLQSRPNQPRVRARPGPILNCHQFRLLSDSFQPIPNRILPLRTARNDPEWLFKSISRGDLLKGLFHPAAHHEHNLSNLCSALKIPPRMRHNRTPSRFKEQLVDGRSHSGPFPRCNDDGAVHKPAAVLSFSTTLTSHFFTVLSLGFFKTLAKLGTCPCQCA